MLTITLIDRIEKLATRTARPGSVAEAPLARARLIDTCRQVGARVGWGVETLVEDALAGLSNADLQAWGDAWQAYCDGVSEHVPLVGQDADLQAEWSEAFGEVL